MDSVEELRGNYRAGVKRQVLVLATGGGKTVMFVYITKGAAAKGLRVLILTHRSEIMHQICATLKAWEVPHCTLTAGRTIPSGYQVMVASVQTLGRRLEGSPRPDFIIVDEFHHVAATSWFKVLAEYPNARLLGVTATPERLDGKGLGDFAHKMVLGPKVQWLIDQGFLSRPRYFAAIRSVDVSAIRKTLGDFNKKEVSELMDRPSITGDAVDHYRRLAAGRTAIAFCTSIAHAQHVSDQFRGAGVSAEVIDGTMGEEQRQGILGRLRDGATKILVSVDLVSEGFDLPAVGAVILLRPTASLALHLQTIGRGLRPKPDGSDVVVLDHVGNCTRHGLAEEDREWSLEGHAAKKRKAEAILETKQCPKCYCIFSGLKCPECGHVRESKAREIEQRDGELKEVTAEELRARRMKRDEEAACNSLADYQALGKKRGYASGWSWFRWKSSWKSKMKSKKQKAA
jgi:DNA repair protein RadD